MNRCLTCNREIDGSKTFCSLACAKVNDHNGQCEVVSSVGHKGKTLNTVLASRYVENEEDWDRG